MSNEESLHNVAKEEYIDRFKNTPSQGSNVLDSIATQTIPLEGSLEGLRRSETHVEEAEKKKSNALLYLLIALIVTAILTAGLVAVLSGAATAVAGGGASVFSTFIAANTGVIAAVFALLTGGVLFGFGAKAKSASSKLKEEKDKAKIVNTVRKTAEKQYSNAVAIDGKDITLQRQKIEHELDINDVKNKKNLTNEVNEKDMTEFEANQKQFDFIKNSNSSYKNFIELYEKSNNGTATRLDLEELLSVSNYFLAKNKQIKMDLKDIGDTDDTVRSFVKKNMDNIELAKETMMKDMRTESKLSTPTSTLNTINSKKREIN
jgi:hypothetical protein